MGLTSQKAVWGSFVRDALWAALIEWLRADANVSAVLSIEYLNDIVGLHLGQITLNYGSCDRRRNHRNSNYTSVYHHGHITADILFGTLSIRCAADG